MMEAARLLESSLVIDGCQFAGETFPGPPKRLDAFLYTVHGPSFESAAAEMGRIHDGELPVIRSLPDLDAARAEGRTGVILAFQDPSPIDNRLELLRAFYELGLRVLQLTYNKANYIGTGCAESQDRGLTDFGRDVVREMNRLGMAIDLSHVSRRTALEAIELSEDPVVFSHACARALADNPRNRTDEEIRELAAKGGVIGITPWSPICWKRERDEPPSLEDYLDHVEHEASLEGPEHVAFGTDQTVDGTADEEGIGYQGRLYPQVVGEFDRRVGTTPAVRYVRGFRGIGELGHVVEGLLKRGFSEEDTREFLGGNFLRVFERVWRKDA